MKIVTVPIILPVKIGDDSFLQVTFLCLLTYYVQTLNHKHCFSNCVPSPTNKAHRSALFILTTTEDSIVS